MLFFPFHPFLWLVYNLPPTPTQLLTSDRQKRTHERLNYCSVLPIPPVFDCPGFIRRLRPFDLIPIVHFRLPPCLSPFIAVTGTSAIGQIDPIESVRTASVGKK